MNEMNIHNKSNTCEVGSLKMCFIFVRNLQLESKLIFVLRPVHASSKIYVKHHFVCGVYSSTRITENMKKLLTGLAGN